MRQIFKIIVLMAGLVLALVVLSGCNQQSEDNQASTDQPLVTALEKSEPTPLEDIELKTFDALDLTSDTVNPYEGDDYLAYVNDAKLRDRDELKTATVNPLEAMVDALASTMISMVTDLGNAIANGLSGLDTGSNTNTDTDTDTDTDDADTSDETETVVVNSYTNADSGFSIVFPSDWSVTEGTDGDKNTVTAKSASEGAGDAFLENIEVVIEELVLAFDLEEYTDSVITQLSTDLSEFTEVERQETKIGSLTVKRIVYTHNSGGTPLKSVTYVVAGELLKGYTITGTAETSKFASFESDFDAAAESFLLE